MEGAHASRKEGPRGAHVSRPMGPEKERLDSLILGRASIQHMAIGPCECRRRDEWDACTCPPDPQGPRCCEACDETFESFNLEQTRCDTCLQAIGRAAEES